MIDKDSITIVTHDGSFHTDDIFATATLKIFYKDKNLEIIRSRDQDVIEKADIVFDVGSEYNPQRKRFDHHQKGGAGQRENGIPYSSFGLVWKQYGKDICGDEEIAKLVDERIVQCIDGPDNGIGEINIKNGFYPYGLQDIISAERPNWDEDLDINKSFNSAISLAEHILTRAITQIKSFHKAKSVLQEIYSSSSEKSFINIGVDYPGWLSFFADKPEVLYVVYESGNKQSWTVKASRSDPLKFELKKPFPSVWAGLRDEELQKATGVKDAIFCHNNLFIAKTKSKEGALEMARLAVEY